MRYLLFAKVTIDGFDLFAFLVFAVLIITAVWLVVFVGGLPSRIARSRNHPYANAVTAAGWISLVTLGALWPIAFIWAFFPPRSEFQSRVGGPTT
jgi:membrane-bound acyltransferase YfiQ involved in biofilm formation